MSDTRTQMPQQPAQAGPPPGTRVIVDVYARNGDGGDLSFSHSWRFDGYPGGGNGAFDIPAKKDNQPGTPIDFHLHDEAKVGLTFAADPIWVDRAPNPCPELNAKRDPEITNITPQAKLLKVTDINQDACILRYNLRFDPDPQRYHYDPEIRNGGTTVE